MLSFVLIMLLTYTWIRASYSADYHVTHGGHDLPDCGNLFPCGSVKYAVSISHSGDTIYIDHANGRPYQECEGPTTSVINITNSLSLIGLYGMATIECDNKSNVLFNVQKNDKIGQTVSFINLNLTAAAHAISSKHNFTKILISRCLFSGNEIGVMLERLAQCDIAVNDSIFLNNINAAMNVTSCGNVSVDFINVEFHRSAVSLTNTRASKARFFHVYIADSSFYGRVPASDDDMQYPLLLVNCQRADTHNITIVSSKFENFYGDLGSQYVAAIVLYDNRTANEQHSTTVFLNNVTVRNIRPRSRMRALYVRPYWTNDSQFNVTVRNSRFLNNTRALSIHPRSSIGDRHKTHATFVIRNTSFVENYGRIVGYGAACSFGEGHYYITRCQFIDNDNIQKFYTGTIILYGSARATFSSCNFECHTPKRNYLQIYSTADSSIFFEGFNTFDITNMTRNSAIIVHTASYSRSNYATVKNHGKLNITCPRGYRLQNLTVPERMNSSSTFSYFVYSCIACDYKTYSMERGALIANKLHNPKCHDCPRGGKCSRGQLTSQPNFWGYSSGTKVIFVNCPSGYCCEKEPCKSYNSCHGNRTGTLCGGCPQGTSELLFETKCGRNDECDGRGFWIGIFILVLLYSLLFLFYFDIVNFIMAFVFPTNKISVAEGNQNIGHEYSSRQSKPRVCGGILKIVFYYYQVVHIFSSSAPHNKDAVNSIRTTLARMFNLIVSNVLYFECPLPNLRPFQNAVILHSLGFLLLGFIGLLFIAWKIWTLLKNCLNNSTPESMGSFYRSVEMEHARNPRGTCNRLFKCRIATAFTHISLLMYSSSAQLCLSLLRCVPVENNKVLFIDGNLKCYQTFQYFASVYVVMNIIPFCLVPVLGSNLLASNSISVAQFCLACVFPLPFSVHWTILLWRNYRKSTSLGYIPAAGPQFEPLLGNDSIEMNDAVTPRSAILKVLVGPFRTYHSVDNQKPPIPWEGFLIFRRLVLILLFTFIYDVNVRMLLVDLTCVVILVTHLCVRPFKRPLENALETISLTTLTTLSGLTHLQVIYNGEVQMKMKPQTVHAIHIVQSTLILAPVSLVVSIITIAVLYQFARRLLRMVVLLAHKFRRHFIL